MYSLRSTGQKCSALARLYVPKSLWETKGGFKDILVEEIKKITVGPPGEFEHYMGPVMFVLYLGVISRNGVLTAHDLRSSQFSYDKCLGYVEKAKKDGAEILVGGTGDDKTGFYVHPTVIVTKDPKSVTMVEEIFGPILTT